jgi:glyceraldehyde 3-phosphate dehydrogenase
MATIGINGLGRIGKIVFLQLIEKNANVVAINVPGFDINNMETYLKYDSNHNYNKDFDIKIISETKFIINNKLITLLNSRDAKKLNWKKYDINYVIDATGVYLTQEMAMEHNVDYLIMCAPAKDNTPSFMVNGNHEKYKGEPIVNNVSCTSNALIPVLKILNDKYKIKDANFITIHSTTSSQQTVDTTKFKNRTSRSIFNNIIPHTTGASKSIYKILPELEGKINGTSVRVPTSNVSLIDLNVTFNDDVDIKSVLEHLNRFEHIIIDDNKYKISCDYNTTTCPSIIDKKACMQMQSNQVKLSIWYDNEWSYSYKVIQLLEHMTKYNINNDNSFKQHYFIKNKDFENKKVVLRLDWNVPIFSNKIQDFFRIKSTIKTLKYILDKNPKYVLIVSHLGRPKNKEPELSFSNYIKEINEYLNKELKSTVKLLNTGISNETIEILDKSEDNLFLLDNIRFNKEETKKTETFDSVKELYLQLGEIYINDAFACSHRDHLSITSPMNVNWGYGFLIEKEIKCLSDITNNIENKKILAIMGGAKMDDKLPLLDNLSTKIDGIYIAGGNINSILKDKKYQSYINQLGNNKAKIYLMEDGLSSVNLNSNPKYSTLYDLEEHEYMYDIGMQSIVRLTNLIDEYDIIFWNGTLGVVENDLYKHGSVTLVKMLISKNKKVIIGGGDTACFVNKFDHSFYYVSTGGGASLEYLSHSKLVGLDK